MYNGWIATDSFGIFAMTGVAFNILFANLATSKKKVFLLPGLMTWHLYFGLV